MKASADLQKLAVWWRLNTLYHNLVEKGLTVPTDLDEYLTSIGKHTNTINILTAKEVAATAEEILGRRGISIKKNSFLLEEVYGLVESKRDTPVPPPILNAVVEVANSVPIRGKQFINIDTKLRCVINYLVPNQVSHVEMLLKNNKYTIPNWEVSYSTFSTANKAKYLPVDQKHQTLKLIQLQGTILSNLYTRLLATNTEPLDFFEEEDLIKILKVAGWVPAGIQDVTDQLDAANTLKSEVWNKYTYVLYHQCYK